MPANGSPGRSDCRIAGVVSSEKPRATNRYNNATNGDPGWERVDSRNEIRQPRGDNSGIRTYREGLKGEYREKTVVVGSFKPNAWGLSQWQGLVSRNAG